MTVQVSKLTKVETISILVCTLIICKSFNTVCNVFFINEQENKTKTYVHGFCITTCKIAL